MYAHYVSGVLRRMKRSRLTVEHRQELARRHAVGEDVNTLSEAFQVSIRQVYRVLSDEKGDTRGRARVSTGTLIKGSCGPMLFSSLSRCFLT